MTTTEEQHTNAVRRAIWIDEAGDLLPEHLRAVMRFGRTARRAKEKRKRLSRAEHGWWNWHVNRGRMSLLDITRIDVKQIEREFRQWSWRRAL